MAAARCQVVANCSKKGQSVGTQVGFIPENCAKEALMCVTFLWYFRNVLNVKYTVLAYSHGCFFLWQVPSLQPVLPSQL